ACERARVVRTRGHVRLEGAELVLDGGEVGRAGEDIVAQRPRAAGRGPLVVQRDARPLLPGELAALERDLPLQRAEERRRAGSVRPGERDSVAALDLEGDAVEERRAGELLAEIRCDQNSHEARLQAGTARARKEAPGLTFRTPFASWVAGAGRASPERGKVDTVGPDAEHGHRTAFDRHDPDALDGRRPEGERRPSGNGDGACPARLPALHGDDAALTFEPALGGPRPLRPERRPRLHPPVLRSPPLRLQPLPGGAEALPAVAVGHAGPPRIPPHARSRGDDRPARPGLRERRWDGDRGALPRRPVQPPAPRDRRPPRLRHLLRP